jgi:histidinol-phosphate aminotransferase
MTQSALPIPKPGIMDIRPYVAGKSEATSAILKIIKLSSNENALGPSPKAIEAYTAHAARLNRYPDSNTVHLRDAIARVHGLDANRIVCGSGSDELIAFLIHAYAGKGDEVLISQYGFLMYKIYAQAFGATIIAAPEKNLVADVDALLANVTDKTRIVFLANPNNPTGSYLPAAEVARLRTGLPPHIILAIDGAYAEYADAPDYSDGRELVDAGENTVMLRTFSKIYGLSSLRLGWGYYPASIADVMNRVRGPFNVSGAAIDTGIAAIEDSEYLDKIRKHNSLWRDVLKDELTALGLKVRPSLANFLLVDFPGGEKSAAAANARLLKHGVIPREVSAYGLPDSLRITIGTEYENKALLKVLKDFMQ